MKKYILDTNLYVRAFRNAADAVDLETFYRSFAPAVYLSSIVLHEVLVGAKTDTKRAEVEDAIARPLRRTNRIVTPSHAAWERGGRALAQLAVRERLDLRRTPKSFVHDVLLAESCREAGVILLTDNAADFSRIRRVVRFEFRKPWPK